jgi:hypothetical protein
MGIVVVVGYIVDHIEVEEVDFDVDVVVVVVVVVDNFYRVWCHNFEIIHLLLTIL